MWQHAIMLRTGKGEDRERHEERQEIRHYKTYLKRSYFSTEITLTCRLYVVNKMSLKHDANK